MTPLSVRNNNPGNLRPVGAGNGFQGFTTPEEGLIALENDLMAKISGKSNAMRGAFGEGYEPTLENLLNVYAPPSENDTDGYIGFVSQKTGIRPQQALSKEDLGALIPAMVEMEGGKEAVEYFFPEMIGGQGEDGIDIFADLGVTNDEGVDIFADLGVEPVEDVSKLKAVGLGASDITSFSLDDELRGFGRGVGTWLKGDPNNEGEDRGVKELISLGIDEVRREHENAQLDEPAAYMGGQITGAITGAAAAPATMAKSASPTIAKIAKYARANPKTAALKLGAVEGGLYGFGDGEGGAIERAGSTAVGMGAGGVGGLAGYGLSKLADPVLAATKPLYRRFLALADNAAPEKAMVPSVREGKRIRLTHGQASQNPKQQSLENLARTTDRLGDRASDMIKRADLEQQADVRAVISNVADPDEGALIDAARQAQNAYKVDKAKVSRAYNNAELMKDVRVDANPIRDDFIPRVNKILRDSGFDATSFTPQTQKILGRLDGLKSNKITAANLEKMEFWRRQVSNRVSENTDALGKLSPEGVALKKTIDEYDRFMGRLPEEALLSGDSKALSAINDARSLRRRLGVMFERDKVVNEIVKNRDLTDEELANMVLTGAKRSEKINAASGRVVKNLKRAVGEKSEAMQESLQRGTMARLLKKSTGTVSNGSERQLNMNKLRNELDALLSNKTFLKEVFGYDKTKILSELRDDVVKAASDQPGTVNYSNTAYTIMNFIQGLPFGGAGVSALTTPVIKPIANKRATVQLSKQTSDFVNDLITSSQAQRRFFGTQAGSMSAQTDAPEEIYQTITE